ncbi:PREDICTED: putative F-box/kelch-repeat protein At5g28160 [Camelina sativa]|uniref:F-box/kelch-repeat protein At5g28160 n=1 Tax=Camelina sativa TaxID=90675 RepID=A0ABM1R2N1_CAMSA|nr:PREDICTED: putative F-box/kelch-repeat protein At5g28160 [Camelina sativa]
MSVGCVARENVMADVLNGKLYVMGSYANYGEVFDPKTQTWEPLPNPGVKHCFSSIRQIQVIEGKLYVRSNEERASVYDPKEGAGAWWYDGNYDKWRGVRGSATLNWYHGEKLLIFWDEFVRHAAFGMIQIVKNGEWSEVCLARLDMNHPSGILRWETLNVTEQVCATPCQYKDIWSAAIAVIKSDGIDEVWGNIEWVNIVLTVPSSYVFLHSIY